jgi:hypothetical protein
MSAAADHFVVIDLESHFPSDCPTLICKAPADSLCHAVWPCDCEWWCKSGVQDGKPWHAPGDYSEPEYERHVGTFDPAECSLRDWASNSDECLRGEVTIPVTADFDYDCVTFHAAVEAPS